MTRKNDGFTLIETLIYSAITTGLITVAILTVYQFIDGAARLKYHKELAENQKLLEQKIYWALQSVSAVNSPGVGATTTSLSVNKIGFAANPVVIDLDSGIVRLKRGAGAATQITNDYSEIANLTFHQHNFDGRPAVKIDATLVNRQASTSIDIATTILIR